MTSKVTRKSSMAPGQGGPGSCQSPLIVDLYIRVSTDRQVKEGDSLEEQENELKKFCDFRGFQVHHILVERGKSGGNTNRPEYQKLIRHIEAGKINAVVVKKLDRLSRSLLDFESLMVTLQNHQVEFISIRENFDTTNAMGKAMLRIALIFAQLEREQTAERITDVMTYRASQGLHNGGPTPFGYIVVNKELTPLKKEKEIVTLIFQRFLETHSTIEVAAQLNDLGFKNRLNHPWDCKKILSILANPLYKGQVRWKGQSYEGRQVPLISEAHFDRTQQIIKRRESHKPGLAYLQKRLLCGDCLSPMTPSFAINRHKKKYHYYRCTSTTKGNGKKSTCSIKQINMPKTDQHVLNALIHLNTPDSFKPIENQITRHNQSIEKDEAALKEIGSSLETQIQTIKAKQEKYLDALISQPFLSDERKHLQDKLTTWDNEEKRLQNQLFKAQLDLTTKTEDRIDSRALKQNLLAFQTDHPDLSGFPLKSRIATLLKEVIYYPDHLSIYLIAVPWPIEVPL